MFCDWMRVQTHATCSCSEYVMGHLRSTTKKLCSGIEMVLACDFKDMIDYNMTADCWSLNAVIWLAVSSPARQNEEPSCPEACK